nr:MAG TPA: hypothetical protein [Bacteriophage sp.]
MNIDNPYISVYYYKRAEASDGERSVTTCGRRNPKDCVFLYLNYCGEGGDIFK